jgi:hypothetical protein
MKAEIGRVERRRGWTCVHVNGPRHGPLHRQLSRHWSCRPATFSESCNRPWPRNPQKVKTTTRAKAAKASNSYNSRPCGVRQQHTCSPPRPGPVLSTCIQPAPAVARARFHSRCLCGSRLVLTVLTAVASLRFVAASGNKHSSSRASIAPTPGPVIHTPHPCRAATHSTAVQEHDF